jgi:hypothetical protein
VTFPKRWLDDDDAPAQLRDVLRSDRDMDPPAGAERAVWIGLMGQIGGAGAGGAAGAGAASNGAAGGAAATGTGTSAGVAGTGTGTAASGGLLKAILVGAFSGVVAVSGYSALEPSITPPAAPPPAEVGAPSPVERPQDKPSGPVAAPSPEPSSAAPASPPAASQGAGPAPSATSGSEPSSGSPAASADPSAAAPAPAPGSPEERESRLREESEMLRQARAALRGGDTGGAMRLLEQARQKFPGGVLGQEREALTIEALAKGGARDVASARAAAFIQAHPQSPYAAKLQVYVLP